MKRLIQICGTIALLASFPTVSLADGPNDPPDTGCGNDGDTRGECGDDGGDSNSDAGDSASCPPTSCPPGGQGGANPISTLTGNLFREVTDIQTFGAAPIRFTRYFNSRNTSYNAGSADFGGRNTWQHGWNFEVRRIPGEFTLGVQNIRVRYPGGNEKIFKSLDAAGTQYVPVAGWGDRLYKWTGSIQGVTLVTTGGKEYDFAARGTGILELAAVRDGLGMQWTVTRDANFKVKRITNPFGKWIEITRGVVNGVECITQVSTSDGRTVNYSYTPWTVPNGGITTVLTGVSYPGAEQATYTYVGSIGLAEGRPLLETASDPMYPGAGSRTRYVWNYQQFENLPGGGLQYIPGTILEERNLVTNKVIISVPGGTGNNPAIYEGNGTQVGSRFTAGRLTTHWDGEGRRTNYTYSDNGTGYMLSETTPGNGTITYTRDYAGRPLTRTDTMGHTESWTYNVAGKVLTHTDRRNFTTTHTYDPANANLRTRTDYPDGAYEEWTYNGYGQVLTHRLKSGGVETFTYGADGNVSSWQNAAGDTTTYYYRTSGLLSGKQEPGQVGSNLYSTNWRGQVTAERTYDFKYRYYTFDHFGNRTRFRNELNKSWSYTYNEFNRLASVTDPLNRTTLYEYGREAGCGSCTYGDTISRITLPSGKKVEYEYDRSWKRLAEVVAPGTAEEARTIYAYEAGGDLASVTDPRGKVTSYTYDLEGRKLTETDPLSHVTTWTYDPEGNVLTVKRADNSTFTTTYDAMGRPLTTTNPKSETTTYTYHPDGSLASLKDAKNQIYTFTVDLLSRRTHMYYPGGSFEYWYYDNQGNLQQYHDRSGVVQGRIFDAMGRETYRSWSDNSKPEVTTTYDAAGRVKSILNSVVNLYYNYDDAGQLTSEQFYFIGTLNRTVTYTYDADGNRATLRVAGFPIVSYSYTQRNQIATILGGNPPPLASFTYDLAGNRLSKALENGTVATYVHDDAGRLSNVFHAKGTTTLTAANYTYNAINLRITGEAGDSYGYDAADQVTSAAVSGVSTTNYSYDPVGNREETDDGSVTVYQANALNQYTAVDGYAAPTYDIRGNLLSFDGATFAHDAANRMTAGTKGGNSVTFLRDGRNRVVARTVNGVTTRYIYDGWNLVAEIPSGATDPTVSYIHGPQVDEILVKVDTTGAVYYHENALGSTKALSDSSGTLVESYKYDVFGEPKFFNATGTPITASAYNNRFLFTGREYLKELDIYDYRNRMYSHKLGRFLETDPIGFAGGDGNLYRYVVNCPSNFIDPDGQNPIAIVLGAIVAVKIYQHQKCEEFAMEASKGAKTDAEKHCLVSCNYARCIGLSSGVLGAAQSILGGATHELIQFGTVGNSWKGAVADMKSNLTGVINGMASFTSCVEACKPCKGKWNPK